ncbi:MAG TPA: hypothetical protein VK421_19960 [Pyrinomonadaceae bacterium]|nr:hypothetical protein [Pyrinomonadaceae bacterium]
MDRVSFDPSLYVERDIDNALWGRLTKWAQESRQARWTSLRSKPCCGNTWVLKRAYHLATTSSNFNSGIKTIFVEGDKAGDGHPPRLLNPLTAKLFEIYSAGRMSHWRRLKLRFHQASSRRLMKAGAIILVSALLSCLFGGFHEYVTSIKANPLHVHEWFPRFWREYFWEHLLDFPIWFLTGSVAGLPLSLGVSLAVLYLARKKFWSNPSDDAPTDKELELLLTREGLTFVLREICKGWRGVLLLVDDAHHLSQLERQFLHELFAPLPQSSDLLRFSEKHSIMIVTLDTQENARPEALPHSRQRYFEVLEVPAFNLPELQEIARSVGLTNDGEDGANSEEIEALLKQAFEAENVNVLLAHKQEQLIAEMGEEFRKAQEEDIGNEFGLDEMMAVQAVNFEPIVPKSELLNWLKADSFSEYLSIFSLVLPGDGRDLLKKFLKQEKLVRTTGGVCYFDTTKSRALQYWLKKNAPQQLAQAHYFWFWHSLRKVASPRLQPDEVLKLPLPEQQVIKEGAWHASRISYLLNNATSVLTQAPGLTDAQRHEHCYHVVALLLSSAVISRSEGDISEADEMIIDAEEWLCNPDGAQREAWLARLAEQLWRDYWLSGEPATRKQLASLLELFPQVGQKLSWLINLRLEEFLQGRDALTPLPSAPPSADAALCNMHSLTEWLHAARRSHGFIEAALRDKGVPVVEPLPAVGDIRAEFCLRQLQALALNERGEQAALDEALGRWHARLRETAVASGHVGDEALHAFNEARYWHLLAEVSRKGLALLADLSVDEINNAQEELRARLAAACLKPSEGGIEVDYFIWMEARYAYERALQIAALLGWRTLTLEVSFHLAALLQRHTPPEKQVESPPWWSRWDGLFSQCIEMEKELGYFFHTPTIYRIRWKFLEEAVSREYCVEDAYHTLLAVQRARFPDSIKLRFHDQVSGLLNNYGDSDINRRRSAELHKMWAYELAKLPEARRTYERLEYEQADNLNFAAQAHRHLDEFDDADKLLDEAAALLDSVPQTPAPPADDADDDERARRQLALSLDLQRAWLRQEQGQKQEFHALIRKLWVAVGRDDRIMPNLIGSLLNAEDESKLLMESWPPAPGQAAYADPDNDKLSLPAQWAADEEHPLPLRTRFEFRLWQFLSLSSPSPRPTPESLRLLAYFDWQLKSRYSETVLRFAQLGLKFKNDLSADATRLLTALLKAVHFYFGEIEEVNRYELEALLLLMGYEEDSIECRVAYIAALRKHQYLLERELRVRQEAQDWFAVADRVDDYLGVLVDPTLMAHKVGLKLRQSGFPLEKIKELREWRKEVYAGAQAAYKNGDYAAGLQLLTPALPASPSPWVFLEDLQVLNLWLQCARGGRFPKIDEINKRATQLRKSTLQYIHHFSEIIEDVQVQMLALELLNTLQKSVDANDPE